MANYKNIRVELPKEKIVFKETNKNGVKYVYYLTKSFRDEHGKPKNKRTIIGKLDNELNMLIPNNNYYELFSDKQIKEHTHDTIIAYSKTRSYGTTYLLNHIFDTLKLDCFLKESFGLTIAEKIKTISEYIVSESSVMYYLEDWIAENYFEEDISISSQGSSVLFKSINDEDRMKFFKKWSDHIKTKEWIAYDVTSISSYSENISNVEFGYNRDQEHLPQINLGMYYGEKTKLPLYYKEYPGSILDKSHLQYMMSINELMNIKTEDMFFVMDRGFYTKSNLSYMHDNNLSYLMGVSNNLISSKEMIKGIREKIIDVETQLTNKNIFGIRKISSKYGHKTNVYIYFDRIKAEIETNKLFDTIRRYEKELQHKEQLKESELKRYEKYFKITVSKDNSFTFKKKTKEINDRRKSKGFFILLSNKKRTAEDMYRIYRNKDVVEKAFDNFKNYLDGKRLHIKSDAVIEGKIFTMFIALILKSFIENKARDLMNEQNITTKKLFKELNKIKIIELDGKRKLEAPLTAKQKKILKCFDISEEKIYASI